MKSTRFPSGDHATAKPFEPSAILWRTPLFTYKRLAFETDHGDVVALNPRKPNGSPSVARRREHVRGVGEDERLRPVPRPDDLCLFGKVEELCQSAPILASGVDRRAAAAVALEDDRPWSPSVPAAPC